LKPPEIRAAFLFCNILPCQDFTVGYDYAVEGLTEKEKAIAAVVILGLNVGLGIVLGRLDEVFSFFVMMIAVPIWASLAWAVGWYFRIDRQSTGSLPAESKRPLARQLADS
jgi:hypothetical protein